MVNNIDFYKKTLEGANIRPTFQRIKILEYLNDYRNHPNVDEIYNALCPIMPTLSKTTVYNTLKAFVKSNIVNELNIENTEARYDLHIHPHGHFKCKECGQIFDFAINMNINGDSDLNGFKIDNRNVFFEGICSNCLKKN